MAASRRAITRGGLRSARRRISVPGSICSMIAYGWLTLPTPGDMGRRLLALAALFLLVRVATIAAYRGHWFAHDPALSGGALSEAKRQGRHIPIEEWDRLQGSGRYVTFPAADLPGLGYLIALTSRWLDDHLTTRWAMAVQVLVEMMSVLLYVRCIVPVFGG